MKFINLLLVFVFVASCNSISSKSTPSSSEYKAVYLVRDQGVLSSDDLKAHPEVLVVHSTEDFQNAARSKISLWVDKNAIDLIQMRSQPWLSHMPQRYYPVVLVGISDPILAFHELVPVAWPFEGPPAATEPTEPTKDPFATQTGFSVYFLYLETPQHEAGAYSPGFDKTPTVQDILDVTNPLLEGKVPSTPNE